MPMVACPNDPNKRGRMTAARKRADASEIRGAALSDFAGFSYLRSMKTRILFVCLGNICRSPAAEGILGRMAAAEGLADVVLVDSAGTYGGHAGELPDVRMRRAASLRGYDLVHRARRVCEADFDRFDLLVAMDDVNYEDLFRLAPSRHAGERIFRMAEFFRRHPDRTYVPDPYYEGREGFERVLDLLEDGCEGILEHLQKRLREP